MKQVVGAILLCLSVYFFTTYPAIPESADENETTDTYSDETFVETSDETLDEIVDEILDETPDNSCVHIGSWTISENYYGNLVFMKNKKILREILYY